MLINGNTHSDERGKLCFVNDLDLQNIRRFYTITHPDINIIRAWQGHKIENKHFFVTKGSFLFNWVKIDDWDHPSTALDVNRQVLTSDKPAVLTIVAGCANGFKALEPDSTVIVFSDLTLDESAKDMYRFERETWNFN
ncbi:MAG: hypothetical protein H0W73_06280 [Bacteroidetes bacterium]|nr:hypothetical protein [Bacteroidota bacterium]